MDRAIDTVGNRYYTVLSLVVKYGLKDIYKRVARYDRDVITKHSVSGNVME